MPHRLETERLRCGYGSVTVVPSFDLNGDQGTILALLGPNGSGKTTVLETIAGLLPALDGVVTVDGYRLRNGQPHSAQQAGVVLVPDDRALFFGLTVDENLRAARGQRSSGIGDIYDRFPPLARRRRLPAGQLSGGEQQMLAIARALLQDPRVLLIDEMSMGLSPVVVEQLAPMIRSIAEEARAMVVIVEQHVDLALQLADRAMVLCHGVVTLDAACADLLLDPRLVEEAYFGPAQ